MAHDAADLGLTFGVVEVGMVIAVLYVPEELPSPRGLTDQRGQLDRRCEPSSVECAYHRTSPRRQSSQVPAQYFRDYPDDPKGLKALVRRECPP